MLSGEERKRIIALYEEGKTRREISALTGRSRGAINDFLVPLHQRRLFDRNRLIQKMCWSGGATQKEAAEHVGCSISTVKAVLRGER